MKDSTLQGKRYVALARCSTVGQADTSNPDQLGLMAAFAREHQMVHVADVRLDGVTGSIPGTRTDIDQIIQRKQEKNDFDVLLVQDTTRFTRGGVAHGNKLEYDLAKAGVTTTGSDTTAYEQIRAGAGHKVLPVHRILLVDAGIHIIEHLNLRRPIYLETARNGHFGRNLPNFTWEKTDKAAALKADANRKGIAGVGSVSKKLVKRK